MERDSRVGWQGKGALEELMRERIRATIETIVDEELEAALGAARSQRGVWCELVIGTASARER